MFQSMGKEQKTRRIWSHLRYYPPFGHALTVVYCRTRWDDGKGKAKAGEEAGEEGYMNLGKMIGASSVRGTTTL